MRTQDDIVEVLRAMRTDSSDFFGFKGSVLMDYLDFEHATEFLRPEVTQEQWHVALENFAGYGPATAAVRPIPVSDTAYIKAAMQHYANFGWEKIEDHRGISAGRTVNKMWAWLYLLEDEQGMQWCDDEVLYTPYGAPILHRICEKYGFDIPQSEFLARMVRGEKCTDDCTSCYN